MGKIKFSRKFFIIIYIIFALFIIGGFIFLKIRVNNMPVYKFTQTGDSSQYENEKMYITMPIEKGWTQDGYHCNQYKATVFNNTAFTFTDWSVTFNLPDRASFHDHWNVDIIENEDGSVTIVNHDEQEFNHVIEPNSNITFGFQLFSYNDDEITDFVITASPKAEMKDFVLFPILCVLSLILLICIAITIANTISEKRYTKQRERDKNIIVQSMKTFSNFIDAKDPYTNGHSARVAYYSKKIATKMDFDEDAIDNIYYIALLHDVGKIIIPDEILNKPAKLTKEEMDIIKTHTTKGAGILKDFSTIPGILDGAKYHHEQYDGSGYPEGLSGESIPLISRIIGVADSYDAMNSDRCYRKALSAEKIRSELVDHSGQQFDPKIVEIMLSLIDSNAFDDMPPELIK